MKRLRLLERILHWLRKTRSKAWDCSRDIDSHKWESKAEIRRRLSRPDD